MDIHAHLIRGQATASSMLLLLLLLQHAGQRRGADQRVEITQNRTLAVLVVTLIIVFVSVSLSRIAADIVSPGGVSSGRGKSGV